MMTIAILAVAVMTSVATPTAVYKRTASSSAEAGIKAAPNCAEIRALTLNGFSQLLRCEPEHGVVDNDHAATSHPFSALGK